MKSFLYALIILGLIAAIAGMFIIFNDRNKAISGIDGIKQERNRAVDAKKKAEDELNEAIKAKQDFEKMVSGQKEQTEQTKAELAKLQSRINDAAGEKERSSTAIKEADEKIKQAIAAKKDAEAKVAESERRKAELEAKIQSEIFDRQIAEANLENERKAREATEAEYRKVAANAPKSPDGIGRLFSGVISTVFLSVMSGDKHYTNACGEWNNAQDEKQKLLALDFFEKARAYYTNGLKYTKNLEYVSNDTEKIKSNLVKICEDKIGSSEAMIDLLTMIVDESEVSPDEKEAKMRQASAKESSANKSTLETCNVMLSIMDSNEESFTKTQRESLENIKKEIERKFKNPTLGAPPKHN